MYVEALKSKRNAGWIVIFLALVVFLLLGLKAANASPRCVASDGGINYYTKGTVSGSVDGKPVTFTDYCKGDFLVEFYCQYNTIRNVTKFCQTGCSDGECNKCIPGEQRCRDNFVERCNVFGTGWSRVQSCRYGCSEGMCTGERQVGSAVQTEFAIRLIAHLLRELFPTCYDSDGWDFYTKGYVESAVYWFGESRPITIYDFCEGYVVVEQICAMGIPISIRHRCELGCIDGACAGEQKPEEDDSEEEKDEEKEKDSEKELPERSVEYCELEDPLLSVCPFDEKDYDFVIDLKSQGIRTDKTASDSRTEAVEVEIHEGTYAVTLVAYDGYANRAQVSQPKEQYRLVFLREGSQVAVSNAHDDLENYAKCIKHTQRVNENLLIPGGADSAMGVHAFYPDKSSPNSLHAVCAGLNKKQQDPEDIPIIVDPDMPIIIDNPGKEGDEEEKEDKKEEEEEQEPPETPTKPKPPAPKPDPDLRIAGQDCQPLGSGCSTGQQCCSGLCVFGKCEIECGYRRTCGYTHLYCSDDDERLYSRKERYIEANVEEKACVPVENENGQYSLECRPVSEAITNRGCYDTEGGEDYYKRGQVISVYLRDGGPRFYIKTDECKDEHTLIEYFCSEGGASKQTEYDCSSEGKVCSWGECVNKEDAFYCFDSDGGKNYYDKGYVEFRSDKHGVLERAEDYCRSVGITTSLYEAYCAGIKDFPRMIRFERASIPAGYYCSDGSLQEIDCESSSGGILAYTAKHTITKGSETYTDSCENDKTVKKYYCYSNEVRSVFYECGPGFICQDGACVNNMESPSEGECKSTESQDDFSNKGRVVTRTEDSVDYCMDNYLLVKHFCEDRQVSSKLVDCSEQEGFNFCSNGACSKKLSYWGTCRDSGFSIKHGGINPYEKNEVFIQYNPPLEKQPSIYEDKCVKVRTKDGCVDAIKEYFCARTSIGSVPILSSAYIICPGGCSNGVCIGEPGKIFRTGHNPEC